jgi:demethoxyubiquinone hydroxylase (CLK1/Coq7/Cat5 family)
MERRTRMSLKSVIVPVIAATITGMSSGLIGVKVALSVVETKINYIENDVNVLVKVLEKANANEKELAVRGQWIISTDRRLTYIESKLKN